MKIFGFENYFYKGTGALTTKKKWLWKPKGWGLIQDSSHLLNFHSTVDHFKSENFHKGYTLILSKKNANTGAILKELRKKKKPYLFVDWDEFAGVGVISYDESQKTYELRYKQNSFDLSKVKSVYIAYKEIEEVFFYKRAKFSNKEKVFLARWIETLRTLEFICEKAKWVPSRPSQMRFDSQNKFGELLKAKQLGFHIPKMIYTSDPREVQKFSFDRTTILKESGLKFFEDSKGRLQIFDSKKVDPEDKKLFFVQTAPCMFQEFIDKKYDVRVVVVGNKILSCKIDSQKHTEAKGDWRGREHLVPFTNYKLSADIEKKVLKFAKHFGFQMVSFDLVLGQDGKYYFLEMNRPGQWFFIEVLSGIQITKTLVGIL